MRRISLIAAAFAAVLALLCVPVMAADKGAPATFNDLLGMKAWKSPLAGCYAETSVAGTFLAAGPREGTVGIGGGCDTVLDKVILGAGVRADWVDLKSGSLFAKLGVTLNPSASVYGLVVWAVPDWKIDKAGQLQLGAGAELSIASLLPNTSLFAEGTAAVSKFGPAATKDDVQTRLGVRYRF